MDSCDMFVVLKTASDNGSVIFGKNSDRPKGEVQEVIYFPEADHDAGTKLQCTFIEIEQCARTFATILSKPAWMWGAEMGANEKGVCIGNEAVFTKDFGPDAMEEKLLGMDLVRLGLERGNTAADALGVICGLLEKYGQGGPCCEDAPDACYFNSFIIADGTEAWVLETSGKHWAAEKVTEGVRNISNQLSIGTKIDKMSDGLQDYAKSKGFWDGSGDFDFATCFATPSPSAKFDASENPERRFKCGKELLKKYSSGNKFALTDMMRILRDQESGICRVGASPSVSVASMVSVLPAGGNATPACHWLTATPNPGCSVFKPFIFCTDINIGTATKSPTFGDNDPAKKKPRFQGKVNREHALYKAHSKMKPLPGSDVDHAMLDPLRSMETQCIGDVQQFLAAYSPTQAGELRDLFKDVVETELKIYNAK